MLIGELSKRSGLSRDTIRFYERQGYIKVGRRERRVNNYKEYSEELLRRLLLFKKIKSYGFTLHEAAEIIALVDAKLASCDIIEKVAGEKVETIDQKIRELVALRQLLQSSVTGCYKDNSGSRQPNGNCPLLNPD